MSGKYPEFIEVSYILNRIASCSNITTKIKKKSHIIIIIIIIIINGWNMASYNFIAYWQ